MLTCMVKGLQHMCSRGFVITSKQQDQSESIIHNNIVHRSPRLLSCDISMRSAVANTLLTSRLIFSKCQEAVDVRDHPQAATAGRISVLAITRHISGKNQAAAARREVFGQSAWKGWCRTILVITQPSAAIHSRHTKTNVGLMGKSLQ